MQVFPLDPSTCRSVVNAAGAMERDCAQVIPVVAGVVPQVIIQKDGVDLTLRLFTPFFKKLQKRVPDELDTPN